MSSLAKSECLLRRDARLYCQKRNQRILWETWRDERRTNDSLQRELRYLERSRAFKSRAMDREQGRFLESLVDIFQRQCDIASDRLERRRNVEGSRDFKPKSAQSRGSVSYVGKGGLERNGPHMLPECEQDESGIMLPPIEENGEKINKTEGAVHAGTSPVDSNEREHPGTPQHNVNSDDVSVYSTSLSVRITPHIDHRAHLTTRRPEFVQTAPSLNKRPRNRGRSARKLVTSDGCIITERHVPVLRGETSEASYGESSGGTDSRVSAERRPRTFFELRRGTNLSRQRDRETEKFRRQFLVNALAKELHLSAMRSEKFEENDDIRKKIDRKRRSLMELRRKKLEAAHDRFLSELSSTTPVGSETTMPVSCFAGAM